MSKKPQSKDEALEALDFIVNVLKEHEKDLDRLINELGTVTDALGETGELTCKVEKVEDRINGLQNEITSLVNYLSASPRETASQRNAWSTSDYAMQAVGRLPDSSFASPNRVLPVQGR